MEDHHLERNPRTIRTDSGVYELPETGDVRLDPATARPAKGPPASDRWRASPRLVGRLERLARARFESRQILEEDIEQWDQLLKQAEKLPDESSGGFRLDSVSEVIDQIAQTVRASTAIEGESVYATDVPVALVEQPDDRKKYGDDYYKRVVGMRDLYRAYIWALSRPSPLAGGGVISTDFIQQLHRQAFQRLRPDIAGRFKQANNQITWLNTTLHLLDSSRVPEFLRALCDRTNGLFRVADTSGGYSKLMAIAEFVVDFLAIHPFEDGNGRTARLLSTYLLERAGFHFARFYPVDTIIEERHGEYYTALLVSQRHWYTDREDLTLWLEFYTDVVFTQWLRAHQEIVRKKANGGSALH